MALRLTLACALALASAGCRTEPLDLPEAANACTDTGGRCVARVTSGPALGQPRCASDEIVISPPPQYCPDVAEDCCVPRCPPVQPEPGDACAVKGTCPYSHEQACTLAVCLDGHWWLSVGCGG